MGTSRETRTNENWEKYTELDQLGRNRMTSGDIGEQDWCSNDTEWLESVIASQGARLLPNKIGNIWRIVKGLLKRDLWNRIFCSKKKKKRRQGYVFKRRQDYKRSGHYINIINIIQRTIVYWCKNNILKKRIKDPIKWR